MEYTPSHVAYKVRKEEKAKLLHDLLSKDQGRAVVAAKTKHAVEYLYRTLKAHGVTCERLHPNRSRYQQDLHLRRFKEGRLRVIIVTPRAARHVPFGHVESVYHYHSPNSHEEYQMRMMWEPEKIVNLVSKEEEMFLKTLHPTIGSHMIVLRAPKHGVGHGQVSRSTNPAPRRRLILRTMPNILDVFVRPKKRLRLSFLTRVQPKKRLRLSGKNKIPVQDIISSWKGRRLRKKASQIELV